MQLDSEIEVIVLSFGFPSSQVRPLLNLLKLGGGVVSAPSAVQNKALLGFFVHRSRAVGILREGTMQKPLVFHEFSMLLLMPSNEPLTYCLEAKSSAGLMARVSAW